MEVNRDKIKFIQGLGFEYLHRIDVCECIRGQIFGLEEVFQGKDFKNRLHMSKKVILPENFHLSVNQNVSTLGHGT